MSYDISVYTITTHYYKNYTSNVYPMYSLAFDRVKEGLQSVLDSAWTPITDFKEAINCKDRNITLPVLQSMILDMKAHPEIYKPLNPENGWGNYEGAVEFFEEALKSLTKNKNSIMEIDW